MDQTSFPSAAVGYQQREAALLAPYAMHSVHSRGRKFAEPEHPYRGPYQRDRDRILHSAAFRRLSGKMQVFTGDMGDYHRTRLTHTHEVATIARTIGRALRLNEDLIEALALFHDIGHPPYGHAGEAALDECLADEGGFSHNQYALDIAQQLEVRYPEFPGLNLTREVLEGQTCRIDKQRPELSPLLEVQVVDAADSITYDAHDTDDAVKLGLVTIDELFQIALVRRSTDQVSGLQTMDPSMLRKVVVRRLIDCQVTALLAHCSRRLARLDLRSADEARRQGLLIEPDQSLRQEKEELESFLHQRVYRHPRLNEVRRQAQQQLRVMFAGYLDRPHLLPEKYRQRADQVGLRRAAVEYLASMTDRFCLDQYQRHFS